MPQPPSAYDAHQRERWTRHDAHLWIRPDFARWLKPGTDPEDVYPHLKRQREAAEDLAFAAKIAASRRFRARFGDSMIDSRENLVRIPLLKHIDISAWYSKGNEEFGDLSPRDYLRDKDWDEQMRVGLDRLRKSKVPK